MKTAARGLWRRWREIAGRAAVFQSRLVLWLLYYLLLVPIALVARRSSEGNGSVPAWQPRSPDADPAGAARRQF